MKISENILFSEGFENSKSLAKKTMLLYELSKEQLSKQDHYDFGLRSIKSALLMAGNQKRKFVKQSENVVLMRALKDANMSRFGFEDRSLFLGLLGDLFPETQCPSIGHGALRKGIRDVLISDGFCSSNEEANKNQVDNTFQLFETQQVRRTTMLVGPTYAGKSVALRTLSRACHEVEESIIKHSSSIQKLRH